MVFNHETFHKSISSFKSSMSDIKHQILDLKEENFQFKSQLDQCKTKLEKSEKDRLNVTNELQILKNNYRTIDDALHESENYLAKAQQENCTSLETICHLETTVDEREKECFDLKKQLTHYEHELSTLETEFHAVCTEKTVNKDLNSTLQNEVDTLKQTRLELTESQKQHEELQQKIRSLYSKVDTMSDEINDLSDKNSRLKIAKKKFKALSEKLQEVNTKQSNELFELNELKLLHEEEIISLNETQNMLNKSIGELELSHGIKDSRLREIEDDGKMKFTTVEKLAIKLKNTVKRLEQDLEMTRCELKARRQEVSELKHENLEKDFEIQGVQRLTKEKESLLQVKEKEEKDLQLKLQELSTTLRVSQEKEKLTHKHDEEKKKSEANESVNMMKMMSNLKQRRDEKSTMEQQRLICDQKTKIDELERLWKEEQSHTRAEKIEKTYLKDELDRIRTKRYNSSSCQKKINE